MAEQFRANPELINSDSTKQWINFNASYIKLAVGKDCITRITKEYLEDHGVNTAGIDPSTFQIFNYGKEKPILVFGEGDGSFDAGDYIEFWGSKNYSQKSYRTTNSFK